MQTLRKESVNEAISQFDPQSSAKLVICYQFSIIFKMRQELHDRTTYFAPKTNHFYYEDAYGNYPDWLIPVNNTDGSLFKIDYNKI